MKLSKKDFQGLAGLVGTADELEQSGPKENTRQSSSFSLKMLDAFNSTLKRTGTNADTVSLSALKQVLEGIYWRYKLDWPGDEMAFGKLFSKTFAGPLAKLHSAKLFLTLPFVGGQVKKPSKPRLPKSVSAPVANKEAEFQRWAVERGLIGNAIEANIGEAQKMQDIYQQLKGIAEDLASEDEILLQFAGARPFMVAFPKSKITEDNFFKVFSDKGNGTLIPVAEINLLEDPIVEVSKLPGGDYIIETRHGVVLSILHEVKNNKLARKINELNIVGGFSNDIMPDDIS
jgi:hypothetical protein